MLYFLPALVFLMFLPTVAAALAWVALICVTAGRAAKHAGATPPPARATRWLVVGAVVIPTVAFGASLIAVLSSPGLTLAP